MLVIGDHISQIHVLKFFTGTYDKTLEPWKIPLNLTAYVS